MEDSRRPSDKAPSVQSSSRARPDLRWLIAIFSLAVVLAGFTVYEQIFHRVGLKYIWDEQLRFHRWVIEGTSVDPWQYRILAPYIIEGIHWVVKQLGFVPSYGRIFFAVRMLQNFMVFTVAAVYFRRLSISRLLTALALVVLAWGLTYSGFRSNLAFDTYFDLLFFLLAALGLLHRKPGWIIPISIAAAFNRETGILIPLMVIATNVQLRPRVTIDRSHLAIGILGFGLFSTILIAVRIMLGPRPFLHITVPGWDLLVQNLSSFFSYYYIFAAFSIIPVIAMIRWKWWPQFLRRLFWLVVPIWFVVHSFTSVIAEARVFLVPYVLVLLPVVFIRQPPDRLEEIE